MAPADTLDDFIAALAFERGLAANTCEAYASDLRFFFGFLANAGVTEVAAIAREHIDAYLAAARAAGQRGATRARRTAAIRMWLRDLKARRLLRHDPSELLEAPRKDLPLPRVLSEQEVTALIEEVKGSDARELRDRAMLETLYGCGLRVSELCDLQLEAVIADGELLRICGKGSKERIVPIGKSAGAALTAYLGYGRESFARGRLAETHVFLTRLGRRFTRQGVFKLLKERAAAVGIPAERISPHVLRHSYASHMLSHGADIRAIQELLGHADIGTTQIYTHVDTARFRELHRQYHPRG